jgi:predicted AlkP superfamily pyrophosphatase or phosphodiesterase
MLISMRFSIALLFTLIFNSATAQHKLQPKLVVGIVVDQMRWDFLYRFKHQYTANGFNRLLNKGFSANNCLIPFTPTYTAPGHTCVFTGSVPAIHGIVGNAWYNRTLQKDWYCTQDTTVTGVGTSSRAGQNSPRNLKVTTVTDELRISNNNKSRVFGIALKDRGSILPAGFTANAAYWYEAGKWITSSFYMNTLPTWVTNFNNANKVDAYLKTDWELQPNTDYSLSTADNKAYESVIKTDPNETVFPHLTSKFSEKEKYESFRTTPDANSFTIDFAQALIDNEKLGTSNNGYADFLTLSFSAPDYIGHTFGPNSVEIQDTYLKLDKDLANFFTYLDKKIGAGQYTIMLTADHGVAHVPGFLAENKINGATINDTEFDNGINKLIAEKYGIKNIVQNSSNYQVYLNKNAITTANANFAEVKQTIVNYLRTQANIALAFDLENAEQATIPQPIKQMVINGYDHSRSGDIQIVLNPGYFEGRTRGTSHGLWSPYDAHIPCLFYGWGIQPGQTNKEVYMTDIAPTIAALLKIQMPNGSVGKVITEALK